MKISLKELELGLFREGFYSLIEKCSHEVKIMKISKILFQKNYCETNKNLFQKLVFLIFQEKKNLFSLKLKIVLFVIFAKKNIKIKL